MIVPCPWYFGRVYIIVGKIVKQSRAAIADLTNDQGVFGHSDTYLSFQSSESGQCGDCGSVDYVKMGGWHRHVVASISTNKFHWLALIYLVAMILKHHFNMSRLMAGTSHLSRRHVFIGRLYVLVTMKLICQYRPI
jgi:hypothetical protein